MNSTDKPSVEATLSPKSVVTEGPNSANASNNGLVGSINNGGTYSSGENDDVRSPTSVTMVCSSSSSSLLPTAAATVMQTTPASKATVIPKPFFVMDWLEEINPRDLEIARQMLNTPNRKKESQPKHERSLSTPTFPRIPPASTPPSASVDQQSKPRQVRSNINLPNLNHQEEDSVCRQLYPAAAPSTPTSTTDETTSTTSMSTSATAVTTPTSKQSHSTPHMSPFKKRSIAIGNGWNAKGLHKAKKGSWESALACWENALEIRSQVLGETHPDVANTCNNIGIALGKLARYDEAIEILERALELRAKHHGTREHVEIAATLHNIGNVLHAAQDCAGAIQCFWDAKLLQEQLLGPNHIQVARACVAIANVYYEAQQYEDSREAYCDALQVFTDAGLSEGHPEVVAIQQDLQDIESFCQARYQQQLAHQHHEMYFQHYPSPQQAQQQYYVGHHSMSRS